MARSRHRGRERKSSAQLAAVQLSSGGRFSRLPAPSVRPDAEVESRVPAEVSKQSNSITREKLLPHLFQSWRRGNERETSEERRKKKKYVKRSRKKRSVKWRGGKIEPRAVCQRIRREIESHPTIRALLPPMVIPSLSGLLFVSRSADNIYQQLMPFLIYIRHTNVCTDE